MKLYHGTNWESLQLIFKDGVLGCTYKDGSKAIYLTPDFVQHFYLDI